MLGRQRKEDLWGLLASKPGIISEFQVQRENLSQKLRWTSPEEEHLRLMSGLHGHSHTHMSYVQLLSGRGHEVEL